MNSLIKILFLFLHLLDAKEEAECTKIFGLGDLHTHFEHAITILTEAKLIRAIGTDMMKPENFEWIGQPGWCLVTIGDFDYGSHENNTLKIFRLFDKLIKEAGPGRVTNVVGNMDMNFLYENKEFIPNMQIIAKVGGMTWTHAQIDPKLMTSLMMEKGMENVCGDNLVKMINDIFRKMLKDKKYAETHHVEHRQLASPRRFYYLHQFWNNAWYDKEMPMCDRDVKPFLDLFQARAMVNGHRRTPDGKIHTKCNGAWYNIDTDIQFFRRDLDHGGCKNQNRYDVEFLKAPDHFPFMCRGGLSYLAVEGDTATAWHYDDKEKKWYVSSTTEMKYQKITNKCPGKLEMQKHQEIWDIARTELEFEAVGTGSEQDRSNKNSSYQFISLLYILFLL